MAESTLPEGAYIDTSGNLRYRLQSGDYGAKIAAKFGQPVSALRDLDALNPAASWVVVMVGDDIRLPNAWLVPDG